MKICLLSYEKTAAHKDLSMQSPGIKRATAHPEFAMNLIQSFEFKIFVKVKFEVIEDFQNLLIFTLVVKRREGVDDVLRNMIRSAIILDRLVQPGASL